MGKKQQKPTIPKYIKLSFLLELQLNANYSPYTDKKSSTIPLDAWVLWLFRTNSTFTFAWNRFKCVERFVSIIRTMKLIRKKKLQTMIIIIMNHLPAFIFRLMNIQRNLCRQINEHDYFELYRYNYLYFMHQK